MPVQIIITGDHATDAIAELQNLSTALLGGTGNVVGAPSKSSESKPSAPSQPATSASTAAPADGGKTETKTLDRKAQDEAVKEMIAAGAKDARFDQLTKGRQQEVEKALAKPAEAAPEKNDEADLDAMFGDDAAKPATKVTREQVSEIMGKVGKDKDGNGIQPRLLKIREILVDLIPDGAEPKVKNIPEDKLAEAYEKISKVGD